jgi:thiamine biosynthesis lipoprotein
MTRERSDTFACFGSTCSVFVTGDGPGPVAAARACLLAWHDRFTRFSPHSELSRLNADPRPAVPVTPIMARFVAAVITAAEETGGLVDATLLTELEAAGYTDDLAEGLPLTAALGLAPERRPAAARAGAPWRALSVDLRDLVVRRPPGLGLDGGGLVKGLFADVLAEALSGQPSFAVDCAGDVRVGGAAGLVRAVNVASPFEDRVLHTFELSEAGVATSGIGKRSWLDAAGAPAHHLLDPATGRPAFTGVVQATAIAPTALEAEARAKAAVLSGPRGALDWIVHGGVVVLDDGSVWIADPRKSGLTGPPRQLSGISQVRQA